MISCNLSVTAIPFEKNNGVNDPPCLFNLNRFDFFAVQHAKNPLASGTLHYSWIFSSARYPPQFIPLLYSIHCLNISNTTFYKITISYLFYFSSEQFSPCEKYAKLFIISLFPLDFEIYEIKSSVLFTCI